ncbi:MAG: sugar ABC transporter ATP-binding protein [Spirochaetia bacterium]
MGQALLEMRNISKQFPGVQALEDVSIDLNAGEVLGLVGENGAGKSTLIKILAGDYRADSGDIFINGRKVDFSSPSDAADMGIQFIYQKLITLDTLTVAENLLVGHLPLRRGLRIVDWKAMNANAREVLQRMNIDLDPRAIVGDLTVHQKQVLEIAKAVNKKATILVMDEPTAALGEEDTQSLFKIIRGLKEQGVGIIHISHRLKEVFEITDRVTVLRDGHKIDTVDTDHANMSQLISMMVGRELAEFYPKREVPIGAPLMEVKDLSINGIIDTISFSLHRGEILGLFGLLGSGRMNVLRAIYGLDRLDGGTIAIEGAPAVIAGPDGALRNGIGYMPIDRKLEGLALSLSVSQNITMANIDHIGRGFMLDRRREKERAEKWVADVTIRAPDTATDANSLSGGNQQKIVLAKLLETGSRVFLMNEPTRGIDVASKVDIYRIMESLCEAGAGIVMISSELPEMLSMADRIIVIARGRITAEFDRKEATQEKLLRATTV